VGVEWGVGAGGAVGNLRCDEAEDDEGGGEEEHAGEEAEHARLVGIGPAPPAFERHDLAPGPE